MHVQTKNTGAKLLYVCVVKGQSLPFSVVELPGSCCSSDHAQNFHTSTVYMCKKRHGKLQPAVATMNDT